MTKNNILAVLASGFLLWPAVTGCSDDKSFAGSDTGTLKPLVDLQLDPLTGSGAASSSRATVDRPITVDDLSLRVTAIDGDYTNTWTPLSSFDPAKEFPVGMYSVEAFYGDEADEGYGKPYYYGSDEVKVSTGRTTEVSINAALANSIIKVVFTDAFKEYMAAYTATVNTAGAQAFVYDEAAADELYVKSGETSLDIEMTKPNGLTATLEVARFTAKPRYRHTVTVDVNGGEVGKAEALTITFDETLESKEFTIDITDDVFVTPAPEVTPVGFDNGVALVNVETTAPVNDLKMNVVARGKIQSVNLVTSSAALIAAGWPESVDLASPGADKAKLEQFGVKTLGIWNRPDVMGVIDLTSVMSKIPYVEGGDNLSTFSLTVTDKNNKTSEPTVLIVDTQKLNLELLSGRLVDEGKATVEAAYNGGLPEQIAFRAKNSRNTWTNLTVVSAVKNANGNYDIELTHPAKDPVISVFSDLTLEASQQTASSTLTILAPAMLIAPDFDVYATHAKAQVHITKQEIAANPGQVKFMLSTDGGATYAEASAAMKTRSRALLASPVFELTGLQSATTYVIKAVCGQDESDPVTIETEAATQLENPGMEEWSYDQVGKYQTLWYPSANKSGVWATMNPLTTSQHSNSTRKNTTYCANSGTMPANANIGQNPSATNGNGGQHDGANAALIRTVGWGSGNTAAGAIGNCQHVTPGELFLGSSDANGAATRGIAFSSRPSALEFYAKYAPKKGGNGDFATVNITVRDADKNVIATASREISDLGEYTLFSMPLTYSSSTKAASIEVNFKSSGNSAAWQKDGDYLSNPSFGNLSTGQYLGAQLWVDDIKLIY